MNRRVRVLVVEDSQAQARQLKLIHGTNGYDVSVARNGVEALGLMKNHKPEIVISDIMMPEMRVVDTNWEGKKAYLASLRDVTDNVQLREKLRNLSLTDELTGLYNRRGFITLVKQRLNQISKNKGEILLVFADLDNLKWINDSLGHHEGDKALIETASILKGTFRESDIVGRIGGDEFAVLVTGAHENSCEILRTRLQDHIDACNTQGTRLYHLSMSVGMAHYDSETPFSINDLLVQADQFMYEQKRDKGN